MNTKDQELKDKYVLYYNVLHHLNKTRSLIKKTKMIEILHYCFLFPLVYYFITTTISNTIIIFTFPFRLNDWTNGRIESVES